MESNGYWSKVLSQRLSRRRTLVATGAGALGAAFLAACGGGGGGSSSSNTSGLLGQNVDTTKTAVAGGTLIDGYFQTEVSNLDPLASNSTATNGQLIYNYSQMVKAGLNTSDKRPGIPEITGDAADKWEFSPDLLQMTMHIRPDHKFDPRPPTNGRAMTSDDVKWSWDKFVSVSSMAGDLANSKSDLAPITSVTTPDASTVVFKQAYPFALLLEVLANYKDFYVQPHLDNFNFKTDMRGSGPYFLDSYETSLGLKWKKNPDWYEKGQPFFDAVQKPLLQDYASGLSQFESGNVWNFNVVPTDILAVKQRNPGMVLLRQLELGTSAHTYSFSTRDDSIFKDTRARQALAMTLDRDLLIDTFFDLENFAAAGLPADKDWNSHVNASHPEWVDPKGSVLGTGAQYFKYDLANARKLLDAAGIKIGSEVTMGYYTTPQSPDVKQNETMFAMINDSKLFSMKADILEYQNSWRTAQASLGKGYTGILFNRQSASTVDSELIQVYTPTGHNAVRPDPIPGVQELILAQRQETDPAKRMDQLKQIQQKLAIEWPAILYPGQAPAFWLKWPWLENYGDFHEGDPSSKQWTKWWYNATKKA